MTKKEFLYKTLEETMEGFKPSDLRKAALTEGFVLWHEQTTYYLDCLVIEGKVKKVDGFYYHIDAQAMEGVPQKIEELLKFVCEKLFLTVEEAKGKSRRPHLVDARRVFSELSFRYYGKYTTLRAIGFNLNRKHCDVLHYKKTCNNFIDVDIKFKAKFEEIEQAYIKRCALDK